MFWKRPLRPWTLRPPMARPAPEGRALRPAALALLALLLAVPQAHAEAGKETVVFEQALTVAMGGHEVGVVQSRDVRTPTGFRFERTSTLRIQRGPAVNEVTSRSVSITTADLEPVEYRFERTDASGTLSSTGRIAAGELVLVTEQAGGRVEHRQALPAGATFATALEHLARARLKDGARIERPAILEELGAIAPMQITVKKRAGGFTVTTSLSGLVTEDAVDEKGRTELAKTAAVGIVAYPIGRPPPEGAVARTSADLLARSTWSAPRLQKDVARVRYRITTPDARAFAVPEDARQKVVSRTDRHVEIEVKAGPSTRGPLSRDERARRTAATPYEAVADPRIVEVARKETAGAKTTREKVERLVAFVYEHVDAKSLDRGYAPALATLESRAGDCTEHSVLLSALLRSLGIPTRIVDGLVVDGGRAGYHEWVEVQIDDEGYVPADPTFGAFPAGPERLKLAEGSTSPEEHLALSLAASRLLQPGVKIEVVDATPPPSR